MSRWMMPFWWACWIPWQIWMKSWRRSLIGRRWASQKAVMGDPATNFLLFQECPWFIFELAESEDPGRCALEAVTVKSMERSMDGLVRPEDPAQPLTVIEIQFQRAANIYNRIVTEMALVQEAHDMRPVRGTIFFASRSLDPAVAPWMSCVQVVMLDEVLARRETEKPDDPLVAVFKPVFEADDAKLEKEAAAHYRHIQTSNQLTAGQTETLLAVFLNWLLERFRDRSQKEIAMILDLPDIEDTRAGRELLEKGIEKGRQEGIERGIEKGIEKGRLEGRQEGRQEGREEGLESGILLIARKRFGADSVDGPLEAAIRGLRAPALERLLDALLDLPDVEALRQRVEALSR